MCPVKKILCAVDFQDDSPRIAAYAKATAKAFGADLLVMHVVPILAIVGSAVDMTPDSVKRIETEALADAEAGLREFMHKHFKDIEANLVVVTGSSPAQSILDQAQANHADMIVMGSVGRKGIDRFLFGSVADEVVKSSVVPVLVVRPVAD